MKSLLLAIALLMASPAFAGKLSCVNKSPEKIQNNFAELIAKGLVEQGAVYQNLGGGINEDTNESISTSRLTAGKLMITRKEISKNGRSSVTYSLSIAAGVGEHQVRPLVESLVEKAQKGLNEKDAKDLQGCMEEVIDS